MRMSDWSSDVCSSDLPEQTASSASRRQDPSGARRARGRERCGKVATIRHRQADAGDRHKNRRTQERTATRRGTMARSEEHTSELQSLMRISYAVFCLKQKKKITSNQMHIHENKT